MNLRLKTALLRFPMVRRYALARRQRAGSTLHRIESWLIRAGGIDGRPRDLVNAIRSGDDLNGAHIRKACAALEAQIQSLLADPIAAHRDIGQAIFDRDSDLYISPELPAHLRRFTYPAYLSVHLNEHCNAACFFCREQDFKGRLLDFEQLHKIDSGLRMARVIELTGWGEPFFYPKLEQVVDKCLSLNSSKHLLSFTTNGSMLSAEWGRKLSGKIHRLCISINAATGPTYETQMRYKNKRFTFQYVIDHIRAFMSEITADDRSRIAFHMVANSDNFSEIPELVRIAAELGIPTLTIGNFFCADERYLDKSLVHIKNEFNDTLDEASAIAIGLGIALHARRFFSNETTVMAQATCLAPFERLYAEVPGDVSPCCYMGSHRMGNIYEAGVEAVWFSEQMQSLRKSRYLSACSTCTLYNPFDDDVSHLSPYLIEKRQKQQRNDLYSLSQ